MDIEKHIVVALIGSLVVISCSGSSGSERDPEQPAPDAGGADTASIDTGPENAAPEPDAGSARVVAVGDQVTVDASGSSDPDGDTLDYTWSIDEKPEGASAELDTPDNVAVQLTPDQAGLYELVVEVSDGTDTASDSVEIEARVEPTADAGSDKNGKVGEEVTLDGTGSTTPGDAELSYAWSFVRRPDQSTVELQDASSPQAMFVPDKAGTYIVELTVGNEAAQASDRTTVEVQPEEGLVGSTVYVSPEGDDQNLGVEDEPLRTLAAALELAGDEEMVDRVQLAEGTYALGSAETITSELEITGPSGDPEAVIEGDGKLFGVEADAFLTLTSLKIESGGTAVSVGDEAATSFIEVTCRAVTCLESGSLFEESGGRLEIKQSTFVGKGASPKNGIEATAPDDISVIDTTIEGFESRGLHILNGALQLRGSTLRDNGKGLHLLANEAVNATLVADTDFRSNETALLNTGAKNVTLQNSSIKNSTSDGIVVDGGAVQIQGTRIESVLRSAVVVNGDAVVTLRNAEIIQNLLDGLRVNGPGARVDLGTASDSGGNVIEDNVQKQLHDRRPDGATGNVTLSDTQVGSSQPPAGTYSGPGFDNHGIVIENDTEVVVH